LSGKAESGLLYLGKYKIFEKAAPYGMTLNLEPQLVELTPSSVPSILAIFRRRWLTAYVLTAYAIVMLCGIFSMRTNSKSQPV
jgi:hypothetical protein